MLLALKLRGVAVAVIRELKGDLACCSSENKRRELVRGAARQLREKLKNEDKRKVSEIVNSNEVRIKNKLRNEIGPEEAELFIETFKQYI